MIETDQAIATKVLKIANSAYYGMSGKISSIQHATTVLGIKTMGEIVAVAGLAQNFAAVSSLVTTGIQKGHMKMHLLNMLNQLGANSIEKEKLTEYFKTNSVNHRGVADALYQLRKPS